MSKRCTNCGWINGDDADEVGVFCPPDEYKGDFARAFFYIASTYGDTAIWIKEAVPNHMTNDNWQEFQIRLFDNLIRFIKREELVKLKIFISHSKKDDNKIGLQRAAFR